MGHRLLPLSNETPPPPYKQSISWNTIVRVSLVTIQDMDALQNAPQRQASLVGLHRIPLDGGIWLGRKQNPENIQVFQTSLFDYSVHVDLSYVIACGNRRSVPEKRPVNALG